MLMLIKMLFGLVCLNWFDTVSVVGTFLTIVIVQLLNANFEQTKSTPTTTTTTTIATPSTTTIETTKTTTATTAKTNGEIRKQQSEIIEDLTTPRTTTATATPTTPTTPDIPKTSSNARHSLSSLSNLHNPSIQSVPISNESILSDEYHEDEDTLSLDNLFPCDQTEIYASKKISFIIDELIQTEMSYVNNLRKGLEMYGTIHERPDLPESLQGKEKQIELLGNIDEILELHEKQILPLMLRNQRDLKTLFDEFATHFDKDSFYAYVIFMMNKKTSMQLRQEQREWFQNLQNEIKDKLGIDSFLVQPIQRLTRYPLLLQQFISEFYKSGISCKPVLTSVCKLETRMRRTLEVVNQAEQIASIDELNELNIYEQGRFRRSTDFETYHYRTRKKYHSKVFLFDQCLLCAEIRKKRLVYRQHLSWNAIEIQLNNSKSITLLRKPSVLRKIANGTQSDGTSSKSSSPSSTPSSSPSSSSPLSSAASSSSSGREEIELNASEASAVTLWLRCARKIIETSRIEAQERCRFSLPMDLVLGVAFAIWLIWHYLY